MRRVLVACALGFAILIPGVPAVAADGGVLVVDPAAGTIDTAMDVMTTGVCTRGVTFVVAVRGKGLDPVTSGNAVGNTELAVLEPAIHPGHHTVPLSSTLRSFFVANGIAQPKGDYDLVFACRNKLDLEDLQTFTATIRVAKDRYTALGTSATPVEEVLAATPDETAAASPSGSGESASDQSAQKAVSEDPTVEASPAAQDDEAPAAQDAESAQQSAGESGAAVAAPGVQDMAASQSLAQQDDTWRYALIGLGMVLLCGAAYMGWRTRSR